ncbi:hypothetical protein CDAR_63071 [Caerostris darwini]|uniref:Uncharacterized protein n=1 Tax=Caerostris darwini TaxID=1538125 RepID=A0AAV4UFD0_9ARAC|nr:hypothetical protein CDAR_63071 [Caerostris darwini]
MQFESSPRSSHQQFEGGRRLGTRNRIFLKRESRSGGNVLKNANSALPLSALLKEVVPDSNSISSNQTCLPLFLFSPTLQTERMLSVAFIGQNNKNERIHECFS